MNDKEKLYDELTSAFIRYQYRIENPISSSTETEAVMIEQYRCDPVFNSKVKSLSAGVLNIVDKYIDLNKNET